MGKSLLRTCVAALAVAVVTVVMLRVPASAQTIDAGGSASASVSTSVTPNTTPSGGLAGAFSGAPTTLLQGLLCPIVTGLSGLTTNVPGVGVLVDQLAAVICAINIAGYVYRTTYLPPTGPPIVRYTRALAGLPTILDVNGDGLGDFSGTLGLNVTLNGITLAVQRSLFWAPTARVSIEAIAIDPAAANTYVGFGLDGTAVGTPSSWQAKLSILGLSASTVDLGLDIKANNPQTSLAAIGEMFSGANPDVPDKIYRGRANFAPVPATFKTEIRASQARQEVIVNSTPTTLTANVGIITPGREQNVDMVADQLPTSIDVVHNTSGASDTTTYDASGPITKLTGAYHDKVNGNIVTAAAIDAWGVPAHISFDQTGDRTSVGATQGGKFDRVQARFAQGSDVGALDPGTSPFARYHRTSANAFTAAVQLSDLKSVSINQSAPYGGELVFATAPGLFPFTADDDTTSTHLEGSLSNLPLDTTVTADLDNGTVTFDGHGTGIDEIKIKATRPTPFFAKATRLDATLDNLPALETVNFKQVNGSVTASATAPLGTISLLASDGTGAPSLVGSGATYDDTSSLWRAFLRISGLTSVSFQADPVVGDVQTSQSQFFTVKGNVSGLTFNGTIDQLPAHMTFSMQPNGSGANVVDFNSHGQAIDHINVNGDGLPAPTGMPKFEATIDHLPSHLTLTLPKDSGNVVFDAHGDHIDRVYAQAWGSTKAAINPARQRLEYVDGEHVAANLLGVGNAEVSESAAPFRIKYDINSTPLDFLVHVSNADVSGTISNPQPATVKFQPFDKSTDGEGGVKVNYNVDPLNHTGDGSINQIALDASIGSAFIHATVDHIPANLNVCVQTDQGNLCKPGWTPGVQGYTVVQPSFAAQFLPTDLTGHVPATPVVVNGIVCTKLSTLNDCQNAGSHDQHIIIQDLAFKTVEAAFGSEDDHCSIACGQIWAEANTFGPGSPSEGDHITGSVRYWDGSGDNGGDPKIDLELAAPDDFMAFNKLFFWLHYHVGDIPTIVYATSGTFTCGAHPHLTIGIDSFPDPDILDGTFGVC